MNTFVDLEKGEQIIQEQTPDVENGLLCIIADIQDRVSPLLQNKFSSIPGNTLKDKLSYLSDCNCCQRHQLLKPKKLAPWVETPFHNTNNTTNCKCDCRHMARFICRQV